MNRVSGDDDVNSTIRPG